MNIQLDNRKTPIELESQQRGSAKFTMPAQLTKSQKTIDGYNIYPTAALGDGKIFNGFESLAEYIISKKTVVIDGYVGLFWDKIQTKLHQCFNEKGLSVNWIDTNGFLKSADEVELMVRPFMGEQSSVWGTKTSLSLKDFYNTNITDQIVKQDADLNIVIGTGATLSGWKVPIIYFDLPKRELQLRMRAGSITNLGAEQAHNTKEMYKRFYFVDWVVCNAYKKDILKKVNVFADGQWEDDVNWIQAEDLLKGLENLSKSSFRVKPWFEPGAWGGQWIKDRIHGLNKDVVNYAWSFELIVPENGLVFESDGNLLEVSFDMLMFANGKSILGKHAKTFGDEFPIRFDFLDTWQGGSLSVQCHPSKPYIQKHFGETITQDETYYILDAEENAKVYLGFQEDINPTEFRASLEHSLENGEELEITDYVQSFTAKKHDLYLIPNGTVHSAGSGNMVLEISATPYIFTFKMYDWLRLGLDGKPRPINIDHAFENLNFDRKGEKVEQELISKPVVIEEDDNHQLIHLPTHAEHFYDLQRVEFDSTVTTETYNICHVMMLVEGESILLETQNGTKQRFAYAETFVVPADAGSYTLTNVGANRAKVIKAFLK